MRPLSPTFSFLLTLVSVTTAITLPSHYDLPTSQPSNARILAASAGTSAITTQASDVSGKSFDYVVVGQHQFPFLYCNCDAYDMESAGGGTAGLVVAARLPEDPTKKVVVLEAGNDHSGDPIVQIPVQVGAAVGNPEFDWVRSIFPYFHCNS